MRTPIEYIKEALGIYFKKENFIFFLKVMAILTIISTLINYLSSYSYPVDSWQDFNYTNGEYLVGFAVLSLLAMFVGLWLNTTTYLAIIQMNDDEIKIVKDSFKKIWKLFLVTLVVGLVILVGLILFIIPAVVFGVWFCFTTFLVLDKNMGVRKALSTSKKMVQGKFFKVLGTSIVFGIFTFTVSFVLAMIPYAGSIVFTLFSPLFLLPFYLLYKDLLLEK